MSNTGRTIALGLACLLVLTSPTLAQTCGSNAAVTNLGGGSLGTPGYPVLAYRGSPVVGNPFGMRVEGALPGAVVYFAASLAPAAPPLPWLSGTWHLRSPLYTTLLRRADATGSARGFLGTPVVPSSACGIQIWAQALVIDPSVQYRAALSAGLMLTFGQPNATISNLLVPGAQAYAPHWGGDIATADFNRDGSVDRVVAYRNADIVRFYQGDAAGGLTASTDVAVGDSPQAMTTGDLSGDHIIDVAVANTAEDTVSILLGVATGLPTLVATHGVGDSPRDVVLGDFDGDGIFDLATANSLSGDISILRGRGDGRFAAEQRQLQSVNGASLLAVGDLNNDGRDDIVVTSNLGSLMHVGFGRTGSTLQAGPVLDGGGHVREIELADLDSDGALDLVVVNGSIQGKLTVVRGFGDGTFDSPQSFGPSGAGMYPNALELADFDGDGDIDAAVTLPLQCHASGWCTQPAIHILPGNGDGTFESFVLSSYPLFPPVSDSPISLHARDLDGNGMVDLTIGTTNGIATLRNVLVD